MSRLVAVALLGTLMFAYGCGGGSSGSAAIVLQSITISPASQTINLGQTQAYNAQCGFSNGPGVCPALAWDSSSPNVATISSGGLATASNSNTGSTTISASAMGVSSNNASLTVQSGGAVQNSVPLIVDAGPAGLLLRSANVAFASVTVCVPGTNNCQTIDHVDVDTGSYGLRILQSALTLPLAQEGNLVECAQFVSFFTWGPVMMADVKMGGEVASNVPIQVIGEANTGFPSIPTACQNSSPGGSADTLQTLGANGLLGVGSFIQDCGPACAASATPGFYYLCLTATTCAGTLVPLAQQVANPVAMFASDNNGVLIQLQAIASDSGQPTAAGTMFFGIETQSNNALGSATIFHVDQFGDFTTVYNGQSYPGSFLDSGSNGIFFLTTALTGMLDCGGANAGWYCPATTTSFTTITQGTTGTSESVSFKAANVNQLPGANNAFNDLTGSNPSCFVSSTTTAPCFDWGLPFFFGRNVFTAIEGRPTLAGPGPYWAY